MKTYKLVKDYSEHEQMLKRHRLRKKRKKKNRSKTKV